LPVSDNMHILANAMENRVTYIYWQHDGVCLGYLEEFPDYWTQADCPSELQENLKDLYKELTMWLSCRCHETA